MLSLASASRIIVHPGATDMRYGIWGLSAACGPIGDGEAHLFCSSDRRSVKILIREGGSLWLLHKRMERGRFQWPSGSSLSQIGLLQLQMLLDGPAQIAAMSSPKPVRNPFAN
jgi:transposase